MLVYLVREWSGKSVKELGKELQRDPARSCDQLRTDSEQLVEGRSAIFSHTLRGLRVSFIVGRASRGLERIFQFLCPEADVGFFNQVVVVASHLIDIEFPSKQSVPI